MMLNGGELDGVRILSPSTVSLMLENHTGDLDLWLRGQGWVGLGYGIVMDRGEASTPLSQGAAYWGGALHYFMDRLRERACRTSNDKSGRIHILISDKTFRS